MGRQNQKWVTGAFLAVSALFSYLCFEAFVRIFPLLDLESKIPNFELTARLASIAFGVIAFTILVRNQSANQYLDEVVTELFKVSWPTTQETTKSLWIVVAMVIISAILLGLIDKFWTVVVHAIL